jgi:type I restriction enzyme M protein
MYGIINRARLTLTDRRRGETLFIDARQLGTMIDRVHRELTDDDIAQIADTYHAWRGDPVGAGLVPAQYQDVPGGDSYS